MQRVTVGQVQAGEGGEPRDARGKLPHGRAAIGVNLPQTSHGGQGGREAGQAAADQCKLSCIFFDLLRDRIGWLTPTTA